MDFNLFQVQKLVVSYKIVRQASSRQKPQQQQAQRDAPTAKLVITQSLVRKQAAQCKSALQENFQIRLVQIRI